jgi:hypothetical protein
MFQLGFSQELVEGHTSHVNCLMSEKGKQDPISRKRLAVSLLPSLLKVYGEPSTESKV